MVINRKVYVIWKNYNISTCSVRSKLFRKIIFVRTPREELLVCTCVLYHYMLFSVQGNFKNSMFDKIIKIDFLKNLSVRFVDYIIFFSFPNLFYVFKTSTAIFSCSATAMKIVNFRLYVHKLMKRGVLREEFLQKLFFRKVHIILNISIYYDFSISLIV